ncbi:DUF5337 domain-containing protein [Aquicoccus porphyridii]|uniref:DUF5337 domain-containing protein n=1 Tax=Aquicoccus porphyridii TaxID=1852029 RepID=A0A5A9ZBX2_9RHOB|nr:DUF5337 domain-containing protein [Aquicoccus porphyridii]KAA0914748.1 hypothetical protein FLO80_12165 [Aquicoccus porphyridii]RAI53363.1 hypothetical protein DOO74_13715 [Rhodobacteraceae bacterium AsT-22]
MGEDERQQLARKGRVTALVIAGTGVFWILAMLIGNGMGLSNRVMALFDLIALAGFILAFVMIFQIRRARRDMEG